jgi:cytochrome c oxidase subunit 3
MRDENVGATLAAEVAAPAPVQEQAHGAAQHRDDEGAKLGMWLFLFTEILLFGGLFLLYAAYLHRYGADFHHAGLSLDRTIGTMNTVILITSSLFMALSITALQRGQRGRCLLCLALTIAMAGGFMVNKFFEWSAKFGHGIFPNSPHLAELPKGEAVFYGLYFTMTGLHGIHVVVGAAVLGLVMVQVKRGKVHAGNYVFLENSGLYWHIVDLVWIFLFPLFYLIA